MRPIFIIAFNLITGGACLVYGVGLMCSGLEKANTRLMQKVLARFTGTLAGAVITGTAVTGLVQSSAAVTVITVSIVSSGIIKFSQAVGIIYGANIGSTVTAQLMSFSVGIAAVPIIAAGLILSVFTKNPKVRSMASALMGLGIMFAGLAVLRSGVPYIRQSGFVSGLFRVYGKNPYTGLIIGMLTTMLVQSSSATVGLTMVLFNYGLISFESALGLTLGDNIGTCMTAQLASLGTNTNGRRTAWAHTLYNAVGSLAALLLIEPFSSLVQNITFFLGQDSSRFVANAHTIFNILSAAVFLPFTAPFVKFIEWIVPGNKEDFHARVKNK